MEDLDPVIQAESLAQLKDSLAKYKRSNKKQRQKLGGTEYEGQLQHDILALEKSPALIHSESSAKEQGSDILGSRGSTHMAEDERPVSEEGMDSRGLGVQVSGSHCKLMVRKGTGQEIRAATDAMDVDQQSGDAVISVDDLPYRALENFKVSWNNYRTNKANERDPKFLRALEEAWQVLQKAAMHNEVRKGGPAWPGPLTKPSTSNIEVTAKWLAEELPNFEDVSVPGRVKEKTFRIWDGMKEEFVDMTDTMLIEARTDPSAHAGCIEEGLDLVLRILTNRNKNQKCLSCDSSGRGQSMSTKGQTLRGTGSGYMNKCQCPIETAALEFWMYKVTADHPNVPRRDDPNIPASDFALNPVSLRLIGAAIEAASGLTVDKLFISRGERLVGTISWSLRQLVGEFDNVAQKEKIEGMLKRFAKVMDVVRALDADAD